MGISSLLSLFFFFPFSFFSLCAVMSVDCPVRFSFPYDSDNFLTLVYSYSNNLIVSLRESYLYVIKPLVVICGRPPLRVRRVPFIYMQLSDSSSLGLHHDTGISSMPSMANVLNELLF